MNLISTLISTLFGIVLLALIVTAIIETLWGIAIIIHNIFFLLLALILSSLAKLVRTFYRLRSMANW